jgi:hypothetical protein
MPKSSKPAKATQPVVSPPPKQVPRPDPGVKSKLGQRGTSQRGRG